MSQTFDIETLRALGLEGTEIGQTAEFVWPAKPAAEGATADRVLASLLELLSLSAVHFRTVNLDLVEQHRLHLEADVNNEGILRFTAPPRVDVTDIRGLTPSEYHFDASDRGIVTVDMRRASRAAVMLSDGRIVAFTFHQTHGGLAIGERPVAAPDVSTWCERAGDPWLAGYLAPYVAADNLWHFTVAASLFIRLRSLTPDQQREALASLLRGEADPDTMMAYQWTSRLEPRQLQRISEYALAEIDGVLWALEELERAADAGDEGQRSALVNAAVRRDDLESVCTTFGANREFDRVHAALELVDHAGTRTIASLPERVPVDEPRLVRVRDADPSAWWVRI